MEGLKLKSDFITLGQLLQVTGYASSGAEAKAIVKKLVISVNKEKEDRRGKKLYAGDVIQIDQREILIEPWKSKNSG